MEGPGRSPVPDGTERWTTRISGCYTRIVLAYAATAFLSGFALFLLGLALFMSRENRKFGDNQFTMKLLPPPPRKGCTPVKMRVRAYIAGVPGSLRARRPSAPAFSDAA